MTKVNWLCYGPPFYFMTHNLLSISIVFFSFGEIRQMHWKTDQLTDQQTDRLTYIPWYGDAVWPVSIRSRPSYRNSKKAALLSYLDSDRVLCFRAILTATFFKKKKRQKCLSSFIFCCLSFRIVQNLHKKVESRKKVESFRSIGKNMKWGLVIFYQFELAIPDPSMYVLNLY